MNQARERLRAARTLLDNDEAGIAAHAERFVAAVDGMLAA
jgi:hypothetical protein